MGPLGVTARALSGYRKTVSVTSRRALEALVAVGVPLLLLLVQTVLKVGYGLNLADEGFLWYGAQRTVVGEVPLRDFMAYDPGRYHWTALWMWLTGQNGILVTRWAGVAFEAIAVALASVAAWRETRSALVGALAGATAVVLMSCWHGRYEPSVALLQAVVVARLLREPGGPSFFLAGLSVGLSAYLGRNLALYGGVGLALALLVLWRLDRGAFTARRIGLLVAGAVLGALPLVAMAIATPGFADAYWRSILRHFELGATNLPLPTPWPWALEFGQHRPEVKVAMFLYGLLHLAMPVVFLGGLGWALLAARERVRQHALFVAAALLALPYAHYAFSRASMEHLVRAGTPLVLAIVLLPIARQSWARALPGLALLAALSFMRPLDMHGTRLAAAVPLLSPASWLSERAHCMAIDAGGDPVCVPTDVAALLEGTRTLVRKHVGPGEAVFIAPHSPGLYAALSLKAPHWEIYQLFPASPRAQAEEIRRMEAARTSLAIVAFYDLDYRPDLRFDATHPMVVAFLNQRFRPLNQDVLPGHVRVGVRP
jgi:hypothetical protein